MQSTITKTVKIILKAFCISSLLSLSATADTSKATTVNIEQQSTAPIESVIADSCNKSLVLLGEDSNHGGGNTILLKGLIVKMLIEKCDFDSIIFESQIYDFIALQDQIAENSATKEHLADAIGGLWATSKEFGPTLDYLFGLAQSKKITVHGMTPQAGVRSSYYIPAKLGNRLTKTLSGSRKLECLTKLDRHNSWSYNDENPFGKHTNSELMMCIQDIQTSLKSLPRSRHIEESIVMANNYQWYLNMSNGNAFNIRDKAMADNIFLQKERLGKKSKTIVWTASIHAAKNRSETISPMGYFLNDIYKTNMVSIGISAKGGSFLGMRKAVKQLDELTPNALEMMARFKPNNEISYFDHQTLSALGSIESRVINFMQVKTKDWYNTFDGIIVLKVEQPKTIIHPGTPQQKAW
jgi:erythromycin esterase-like protein